MSSDEPVFALVRYGVTVCALASQHVEFGWLAESKLAFMPLDEPVFAPRRSDAAAFALASQRAKAGAGGETRTHTTFYGPRILSPVRLPFRHTGGFPKR